MLIYLGAGFQLVGLVMLFFGFVTTWHDYGDGRPFHVFMVGSAWAWSKRTAQGLWAALPGRKQVTSPGSVTLTPHGSFSVQDTASVALVAGRAWPDPMKDPAGFAARVMDAFGEFDRWASAQTHALDTERREREQSDKDVRATLDGEVNRLDGDVERLDKKTHGIATDGLKLEFAGWLCLVAGLIASTIGTM